MLAAAASLAVIALAVLALVRTPREERGRGWPEPLLASAVVLALPLLVVIAFVAPWLTAIGFALLAGALAVRARRGPPRAPRPRPPRA